MIHSRLLPSSSCPPLASCGGLSRDVDNVVSRESPSRPPRTRAAGQTDKATTRWESSEGLGRFFWVVGIYGTCGYSTVRAAWRIDRPLLRIRNRSRTATLKAK